MSDGGHEKRLRSVVSDGNHGELEVIVKKNLDVLLDKCGEISAIIN